MVSDAENLKREENMTSVWENEEAIADLNKRIMAVRRMVGRRRWSDNGI